MQDTATARLQPTEVVTRAAALVAMATRVHAVLARIVVMAADLSDVVAATGGATWWATPLLMTSFAGDCREHWDATLATESGFYYVMIEFSL